MASDVMKKYRSFVADYNGGSARPDLCQKYKLKDSDFEPFLAFLKRKGFKLKRKVPDNFLSSHEIDFEIFGDDLQFVEVELDPGETAIAEAGAMMYMEQGITMETIFGDGSKEHESVMGKIFGAGKRVLTGESLFMTAFSNSGAGKQHVAFSAPYPGSIIPLDLSVYGGKMLCQKDSFLCAAKGVSIGIEFQRKFGAGLFGGEGFILQSLEGDGFAFVHAGGTLIEKELAHNETLRLDTGCVVAFESGVSYDIQYVGGIKSAIFGGEGVFFAALTGPGKVWIQSMPFSRLADRIISAAPITSSKGGGRVGEGSILGSIGDIVGGS